MAQEGLRDTCTPDEEHLNLRDRGRRHQVTEINAKIPPGLLGSVLWCGLAMRHGFCINTDVYGAMRYSTALDVKTQVCNYTLTCPSSKSHVSLGEGVCLLCSLSFTPLVHRMQLKTCLFTNSYKFIIKPKCRQNMTFIPKKYIHRITWNRSYSQCYIHSITFTKSC